MSKKIENATVYLIRNSKGEINQKGAYLDCDMAKEAAYYLNCQYGYDEAPCYSVDSIELPL